MKVLVKEVYEGAEEQGQILEFWIKAQLATGRNIEIFNLGEFDLREFINQEIECLILAMLRKNPLLHMSKEFNDNDSEILEGVYMGDYAIPKKWLEYSKGHVLEGYHGLQSEMGIFLIEPHDLSKISIKKGEKVKFNILRFDLLAWYQID